MKRTFDLTMCLTLIALLIIPCFIIALLIKISSQGPVLHWSKRIGKGNKIFLMPKFRTMRTDTPQVATHLLKESQVYVTGVGSILRKLSLDEIPQLWCIFKGEMSFVGPRPALFNQDDLIQLRTTRGIDRILPGITGWAQINGRDNISIARKVELDYDYMTKKSLFFDMKIIFLTLFKVILTENVSH